MVDVFYLYRDDELTVIFKEIFAVQGDNSSLISLGNISEDTINHTDKHSVFKRLSGISDYGDDVGSLLCHGDEISSRTI